MKETRTPREKSQNPNSGGKRDGARRNTTKSKTRGRHTRETRETKRTYEVKRESLTERTAREAARPREERERKREREREREREQKEKALFEDIKAGHKEVVCELIEKTKVYCSEVLRNAEIDPSFSLYAVKLQTCVSAIIYGFDTRLVFNSELEGRCKMMMMLTETQSLCRLTRGFALAAQGNKVVAESCVEVSGILLVLPEIKDFIEPILEQLSANVADEDESSHIEQMTDFQTAVKHGAELIHRTKPGSPLSLFVVDGIQKRVVAFYELIQQRISTGQATADETKSLLALAKEASGQFPLNTALLTLVQTLTMMIEKISAGQDMKGLFTVMNHRFQRRRYSIKPHFS